MVIDWLNFTSLGLSKLICVAPLVTRQAFSSIVKPNPDIGKVMEVLEEMKVSFRTLQPLYLPDLPKHSFNQRDVLGAYLERNPVSRLLSPEFRFLS